MSKQKHLRLLVHSDSQMTYKSQIRKSSRKPIQTFFWGKEGGIQELHYLWPWQRPARLFISVNYQYILLCLRPLTYCDLQALANNAHIQVQCIHFDTKWLILCARILAQDSRGQFEQFNVLRNMVQLPAVLIRPGLSKRHDEHQGLHVK